MDADPDDRGPEATAQGASVSSDRRAQTAIAFKKMTGITGGELVASP
jgi:hypothetical protein